MFVKRVVLPLVLSLSGLFALWWITLLVPVSLLERFALEEMRVMAIGAIIGVVCLYGFNLAFKVRAKQAFPVLLVGVLLFAVLWYVPLFLPMGSEVRLCWEEMRVLGTGGFLGCVGCFGLLNCKKTDGGSN